MISFLYALARAAAWGRATGKLAGGNPRPFVRRARNRIAYRALGNVLRKF